MRTRQTLMILATLLLSLPVTAFGALERIEEAYELGLKEVTLPAHSASQVVIRRCAECDPVMHPVSSSTVYRVGDTVVALDELRARAAKADADEAMLLVFYATDTGKVTRIVLR